MKTHIKAKIVKLFSHRRWNVHGADWLTFTQKTEFMISSRDYSSLLERINQAAPESIPERKQLLQESKKNTCKPWWTQDCTSVVKRRKEAFVRYKCTPSLTNLLLYKNIDANSKKVLKNCKRESWKKFCFSLNKNTPMTLIWKNVNRYRNYLKPTKRNKISSHLLEEISDNLCPCWSIVQIPSNHFTTHLNHPLSQPFSRVELDRVLKNNDQSTPGKDNLHYSMLYNLGNEAKDVFLKIINRI